MPAVVNGSLVGGTYLVRGKTEVAELSLFSTERLQGISEVENVFERFPGSVGWIVKTLPLH